MALKSKIPQIARQLEATIHRGALRGAGYIVDLAKQLVPKDTTRLEQSIRVEDSGPGQTIYVVAGGTVIDGKPVDYAVFVEYGTSNSPAQPYMTPAANNIDVRKEVADELNKLFKGNAV